MLENWLNPISDKNLIQLTEDQPDRLGKYLLDEAQAEKAPKIAIISTENAGATAIRTALYQLAPQFEGLAVADLGKLRNTDKDFCIQLLRELYLGSVIPVFIAPELENLATLFRGFALRQVNLALCSQLPHFDIHEGQPIGSLKSIIQDKDLAGFSLIGSQNHYQSTSLRNWMQSRQYEQLRLGHLRNNISDAEPLIRDADIMGVHLDFLKQIEAPAQSPASPSGLFSEEACQLMRYAGMSDKLGGIGFFGFDPEKDIHGQSAAVIAQLIWYFIEGVYHRKEDFPVSRKNLTEYLVQAKGWHSPLTFWKSNKSGRWWLQIPEQKKIGERHHLVPCTYENYLECTNGEIPDRLIRILRKFD